MTYDIHLNKSQVNIDTLNTALRAEFADAIAGVSVVEGESGSEVIVHFIEQPTDEQRQRAELLVAEHNATVKSEAELREEALQQLRQTNFAAPLDPAAYTEGETRQLAERIAWLEQEIKRLVVGL